jgi:hypothetical protein
VREVININECFPSSFLIPIKFTKVLFQSLFTQVIFRRKPRKLILASGLYMNRLSFFPGVNKYYHISL